jgi:hypothetical protein|nr:MAG TPA: hypothetical protein [Caudoviricetes sp.]
MKLIYPVIFTQAEDVVLVEVPDMEILTEGKDIPDAIDMARDAIGIKSISLKEGGIALPVSTSIENVDMSKAEFAGEGQSFISIVDVDYDEYKRRQDNKMVRRNVTLPNWLNLEAEKEGINVSGLLQEALAQRLGVQR